MTAAPLRILMVAPQPFLRARGTPFSVLHRIRALRELGHRVELVTYPFGDPVEIEGVKIVRSRRPPGVSDVPIGPSAAKAVLDVPLFALARGMARRGDHDLIHTHEEGGVLGAWLRRRLGLPHLYDMHSSLPQQFENFGRFDWPPVVRGFRRLERYTLDGSDGVIAICDALGDHARAVGYDGPLEVIENTLDVDPPADLEARAAALRRQLGLDGAPVVVYTGSLEEYQGLDLLVAAAARVIQDEPRTRFVLVGGTTEESATLARAAHRAGAGEGVICIPRVAPEEVHVYQRLARVLVTARSRGTNTPLKIYQYLRAGRPVVATRILSHTQVLDDDTAELVTPDAEGLARGILRVLDSPERARALAAAAAELARRRYGPEVYHRRLERLLAAMPRRGDGGS